MYIVPQAERRVKAKERPYHYVYKVTNLVNGNIYVGMRSSILEPEEDVAYMGSGKAIESAIKKYGVENFYKEVTASFKTRQEAFELEELIVDSEFVKRRDTYNQKVGGLGVGSGEDHPRFGATITEDHKKKLVEGAKNFADSLTEEDRQRLAKERSLRTKKYWEDPEFRANQLKRLEENHPRLGRKHSEESKNKMSESAKNRPIFKCPHCSKESRSGVMKYWHFDNCKHKPG